MTTLDTDCPKFQRAMMIEQTNNLIYDARGCWKRAAQAGDIQAMDLFERQGKARIVKLKRCLAAFAEIFGKNYRLKNSAIKAAA
tara:strand:+ start:1150 stop:1401 length:252 start_codon:yes stop_codon:yes gene_type:complete